MGMFKQMTGTSLRVLWRYPETPHMGVKVLSRGKLNGLGFRFFPLTMRPALLLLVLHIGMQCSVSVERTRGWSSAKIAS